MRNYGEGRAWINDAPGRAAGLASSILSGEVGVIEGCRALLSLRHELGDEMAVQFLLGCRQDSESYVRQASTSI